MTRERENAPEPFNPGGPPFSQRYGPQSTSSLPGFHGDVKHKPCEGLDRHRHRVVQKKRLNELIDWLIDPLIPTSFRGNAGAYKYLFW